MMNRNIDEHVSIYFSVKCVSFLDRRSQLKAERNVKNVCEQNKKQHIEFKLCLAVDFISLLQSLFDLLFQVTAKSQNWSAFSAEYVMYHVRRAMCLPRIGWTRAVRVYLAVVLFLLCSLFFPPVAIDRIHFGQVFNLRFASIFFLLTFD